MSLTVLRVARNSSSIELNVQVPILLRMCACRSGPAVKYILKKRGSYVQARCDVSDRPAYTRGPVGLFVTSRENIQVSEQVLRCLFPNIFRNN